MNLGDRVLGTTVEPAEVLMNLKPGTKLRSAVCTTTVVVVRASAHDVELRCGGEAMVPADSSTDDRVVPLGSPIAVGKRFRDAESGLEILCTRSGIGPLQVDDRILDATEPRPLPASD